MTKKNQHVVPHNGGWAVRKQVCPKSPVREKRTPGPVRRLLGNWLSYREACPSLVVCCPNSRNMINSYYKNRID